MSKMLMLSSLLGAMLTLGWGGYKALEMVADIQCRAFPEECDRPVEAVAHTVTQPVAEVARQFMAGSRIAE